MSFKTKLSAVFNIAAMPFKLPFRLASKLIENIGDGGKVSFYLGELAVIFIAATPSVPGLLLGGIASQIAAKKLFPNSHWLNKDFLPSGRAKASPKKVDASRSL